MKIKSAGFLQAADRIEVVEEDPERPSLVAEAHKGDLLTGAIVFNKNRKIIEYQRQLARTTAETAWPHDGHRRPRRTASWQ